ncbi:MULTISPECIES: hypothetical protein [Lactiplantibacillus]|nr:MULTISPECIES: hypothetical protein [Lactiplantibacillus]MBU7470725.1 hypothetical protein [Lactiplantibacillus plantarum]MCB7465299.1 hypothetical protein [Lactiplantibacillus plantarum]MCB7468584.1 hypothetical protein [Lactiplantibacillus plantarum]MCB7472736.1 hypothetical protein [Lactiplantibacillus plantarum]MCB7475168.1 hypothetical protein [Lactiplantibacillus plantarum]
METQLSMKKDGIIILKNITLDLNTITLIITELNDLGFKCISLNSVNVAN